MNHYTLRFSGWGGGVPGNKRFDHSIYVLIFFVCLVFSVMDGYLPCDIVLFVLLLILVCLTSKNRETHSTKESRCLLKLINHRFPIDTGSLVISPPPPPPKH